MFVYQSALSAGRSTSDLEVEFFKRGSEWCIRVLDRWASFSEFINRAARVRQKEEGVQSRARHRPSGYTPSVKNRRADPGESHRGLGGGGAEASLLPQADESLAVAVQLDPGLAGVAAVVVLAPSAAGVVREDIERAVLLAV